MSASPATNENPAPLSSAPATNRPLRMWPAWTLSLLMLVAMILTVTPSIPNRPRFFLMMGGPFLLGLLFSAWVLLLSRLRWKEKLLLAFAGIASPLIAAQVSVPEDALRTAMFIYGVPLAMFLTTTGLAAWHQHAHRSRLTAVVLLLGWLSFGLVRNNGFIGDYRPEFVWRWSPVHEQSLPALPTSTANNSTTAAAPATEAAPAEWPQYRGPAGDGAAPGGPTNPDWTTKPPAIVWQIDVGPAWSSFAFSHGRLLTQEQRGDAEYVSCYSADTGELIWSHADKSRFVEVVSGAGPRSTPAVHGGRVYAIGGRGLFNCLSETDGSLLWQHDFVTEYQASVPMWGFSGSPIVVDGLVVVFAGGAGDKGLVALNADTGELVWSLASGGMNYTTPRLLTLAGQRCLLFGDGSGIRGMEPATGKVLFQYKPQGWENAPMVDLQQLAPDSLLTALGDGAGLQRIDVAFTDGKWKFTERWTTKKLRPSFNDSLIHKGAVYGFNQAVFSCIDAETGERRWQGGRYGFGQAILLPESDCILVAAENGDAVLLKATPDKLQELGRIPTLNDKTWNHPIVVGNRAWLRNGRTAVCLDLTGQAAP
ncbi:MAG: PQQ-binding-like beta-propeller repeat protein [Planctomyces sp.]|jgi:outer membrane protein assembly factor BamB